MPRSRFRLVLRCLAAALGLGPGLTGMPGAAAEPPPPSMVQDDARVFDASTLGRMSGALMETQRDCGVSVYVATSSYLETSVARNHEQRLIERWLQDRPGMIVVYNRGNGRTGVVASPEFWRRHPADEVAQVLADAGGTLNRQGADPEHRIQDTVSLIIGRVRDLEAIRRAPRGMFTGVERKLAISVAGFLAFAGLIGWLFVFARRRKVTTPGGPFLFPEATVKFRLGAQFGGGAMGESSAKRTD